MIEEKNGLLKTGLSLIYTTILVVGILIILLPSVLNNDELTTSNNSEYRNHHHEITKTQIAIESNSKTKKIHLLNQVI